MTSKKFDLKRFLVPILRRKSLHWPPRNEALKLSRVDRGFYRCASCKQSFERKKVHVDHIKPVVNVKTNFTTWDSYIESLYCDIGNLQVLCEACHSQKSVVENKIRAINKKKKKKKTV